MTIKSASLSPIVLPDPRLQEIVDRAVQTVEIALERVVANHANPAQYPLPNGSKTIESVLKQRFDQLPQKRRKELATELLPRIKENAQKRNARLGSLAQIDLRSLKSVIDQIKTIADPKLSVIQEKELPQLAENIRKTIFPSFPAGALTDSSARASTSTPTAKSIDLRLAQILCIKPTKLELGRDEISLGCLVTTEDGLTLMKGPFDLGKFKAGEKINFSPPKNLGTFDLLQGAFPKVIAVTPVLAEVDYENLVSILNALCYEVGFVSAGIATVMAGILAEFVTATAAAGITMTATAGGIIISGTLAPIFPMVAITLLVVAVTVAIIAGIIAIFARIGKDEVFAIPTNAPVAILTSNSALFPNGNPTSQQSDVVFRDFGGEYHLKFDFKLNT